MNTKNILWTLLAILASGSSFYYSTGFNDLHFLLWVAATPILLFSEYQNRSHTFIAAYLAYFIGELSYLSYIKLGLPLIIIVVGIVFTPLIFAMLILVSQWVRRMLNNAYAFLAFPILWVSYEFVSSIFSSAGALDSWGYTQVLCTPIAKIASITGVFGISYCLASFSAGIAGLIYYRKNIKALIKIFLLCFFPIVLLSVLAQATPTTNSNIRTKVALIAIPAPRNLSPIDATLLAKNYIHQITLLPKDIDTVLLPEKIIRLPVAPIQSIIPLFEKAAQNTHKTIIVGMALLGGEKFNNAYLFMPDGKISVYTKQHLLPGPESDFSAGKSLLLFSENNSFGIAVCKDMDFPDLARTYALQGAKVLFVPALDFDGDAWLHGSSAIMRGIENGMTIVRAANHGLLSVSDLNGRTISVQTNENGMTLLTATLPNTYSNTFYTKYGDLFSGACLILCFILVWFAMKEQLLINDQD